MPVKKYNSILVYKIVIIILVVSFCEFIECKEYTNRKRAQTKKEYTAYTNITIIDGKGNLPETGMIILIKDSIIYDIAKNENYKYPDNTTIIPSNGKYAIPGLIDMHAHITVLPLGSDKKLSWKYEKEASFHSLKVMLGYGITTARNPAAPTSDGIEIRELVRNNSITGPDIFTAGASLVFSGENSGTHTYVSTVEEVKNEVKKQIVAGVDFIKVYKSLGPELIKSAIDESHKHNIKVIGDLQNTTWTETAELGINFITHSAPWSSSYLPERFRKKHTAGIKGRIFWLEKVDFESDEFKNMFKSMHENSVSVDPTLIAMHTKFWGDDPSYTKNQDLKLAHPVILKVWKNITFTNDWTKDDYIRAKTQWRKLLKLTKLLYDNGIMLTAGTDFPNPWILPGKSLHQELKLLSDAGISNSEVIKIATFNGAKALGIENRTGSLEKGKIANILILDANPIDNIQNTLKINSIMKKGKAYSQGELIAR